MTKKKSRQKSSKNRSTLIVFLVGFALAALYYWQTGFDPLDLFTDGASEIGDRDSMIVGSGGDWWQVYFTNPLSEVPDDLSGSAAEPLIVHINAAQDTIDVAAFEFNLTPVAEALITAHQRGVRVRWVTDDEYGIEADEEEDHGQFAMLERAGIKVRDDRRSGLMHNKFWIFDGQTVWTGSTNVTQNGIFRNNNNVIVIDSPALADIYGREFEEMWDSEFGITSASTLDKQSIEVEGSTIQVLFAPEDEVISHLAPLIQDAQQSIRFMAFSFTHDQVGAAVLDRARAGVDVRGIFETRASETEYSQLPNLYCAGLAVRQDGNPRTFHHKVFVIDEEIVVTGSFNFSNNADKSNDENVLFIGNRDIAAQYLQEFERRWTEASPPEAANMNCP
jgi:phosphatidylserine/phosphatidylglycerophosphate/cardiolipin synthase-like enzyme